MVFIFNLYTEIMKKQLQVVHADMVPTLVVHVDLTSTC